MEFRKDINSLRAMAIIGVLLFHFDNNLLPGGFSGVDVFFVISGFLMTKIIFNGISKDTFSLLTFYAARCKRIIPALLFLSIFTLVFGWFFIAPIEYSKLSEHVISSLLFISNINYWSEASYFSSDSKGKWLLHTWSLSVEWQFYLIYPLIVLASARCLSISKSKVALLVIAVLSFASSVYMAKESPSSAFYLLPSRAWEMLAGGLVYLFPLRLSEGKSKALHYLGLLLIVLSYVLLDESFSWPGYMALPPVIGSCMVIISNQNGTFFSESAVLQKIGSWSYSIYLWHWPIVVFMYKKSLLSESTYLIFGISLSVLIGYLSFRLFEGSLKIARVRVIALASVMISTMSLFVHYTYGADFKYRAMASNARDIYPTLYTPGVYLTNDVKASYQVKCDFLDVSKYAAKVNIDKSCKEFMGYNGVFVWGDSHAQALGQGVREHYSHFNNIPVYQIASSSCKPGVVPDSDTTGEVKRSCDRSNKLALSLIEKFKPKIVILAQHVSHQNNDFVSIIKTLKGLGVSHVVIVGPIPQYTIPLPVVIAERHWEKEERSFSDITLDRNTMGTDKIMKAIYLGMKDVTYVSLIDKLCEGDKCIAKVDDKNTPIVWDYGHLTPEGSDYVMEQILSKVTDKFLGISSEKSMVN